MRKQQFFRSIAIIIPIIALIFSSIEIAHSAIRVAPVIINMAAKGRSKITLTNTNKQDVTYSLRAFEWKQVNGLDKLDRAKDFIITPPIITLKPGERREVRIGLNQPNKEPIEKTYRLEIQEIPRNDEQQTSSGARTILRVLLPVFIAPANREARADTTWSVKRDKDEIVVRAENKGDLTEQFLSLSFSKSTNTAEPSIVVSNQDRILPKSWREWRVKSNDQPRQLLIRRNAKRNYEPVQNVIIR